MPVMKLAKGVRYRRDDTFGTYLDYQVEDGAVILCTNDGTGWQPKQFLLPHQVYLEYIKEMFAQGAEVVAAFHITTKAIPLMYNSEYSKKRWNDLETEFYTR